MKEYKVVPFLASIKEGANPNQIATQLEQIINSNTYDDWKFYRLDNVNVEIAAGCFGSLAGQPNSYSNYDLVIFSRKKQ